MQKFIVNNDTEAQEKLGLQSNPIPGQRIEVMEDEGHLYIRWIDSPFSPKHFTALSDYLPAGRLPEPPDGTVICQCGNKAFHIRFGDYTVYGICTRCHVEHELYSG